MFVYKFKFVLSDLGDSQPGTLYIIAMNDFYYYVYFIFLLCLNHQTVTTEQDLLTYQNDDR